jgi:hypothetical protein
MAAVQPDPWLRALITTTTTNNNKNNNNNKVKKMVMGQRLFWLFVYMKTKL